MKARAARLIHLHPMHLHRAWWRRFFARHQAPMLAFGAGLAIFVVTLTLLFVAFGGLR